MRTHALVWQTTTFAKKTKKGPPATNNQTFHTSNKNKQVSTLIYSTLYLLLQRAKSPHLVDTTFNFQQFPAHHKWVFSNTLPKRVFYVRHFHIRRRITFYSGRKLRNELIYLVVRKSKGTHFQNSSLCIIQFLFMVCTFQGSVILRRCPLVSLCCPQVRRERQTCTIQRTGTCSKKQQTHTPHSPFFAHRLYGSNYGCVKRISHIATSLSNIFSRNPN